MFGGIQKAMHSSFQHFKLCIDSHIYILGTIMLLPAFMKEDQVLDYEYFFATACRQICEGVCVHVCMHSSCQRDYFC